MKKNTKNKLNYAVWIDHKKAIVLHTNERGELLTEQLLSNIESQHRIPGETTDKTRLFATTLSNGKREQNRENEIMHQFYKKIITFIPVAADFVLIAGPADAKYELHRDLSKKKSLAHVPVQVKTTGKFKAPEVYALLQAAIEK